MALWWPHPHGPLCECPPCEWLCGGHTHPIPSVSAPLRTRLATVNEHQSVAPLKWHSLTALLINYIV
eukprot:220896-Prorocentrum_minimum.AAC.1